MTQGEGLTDFYRLIELPTGEQIKVAVLTNTSIQVRIGTDAPDDIAIVREELLRNAEDC